MGQKLMRVVGVLLLLMLFVTTVLAQDDPQREVPPTADKPIGEVEVLEVVETAEGTTTTIQIPVTRDAYIASNRPNENFGFSPELRLGFSANAPGLGAVRPLMFFSLNSIPRQASIDRAEFEIFQFANSPAGDAPMGFQARYLNSDWNEGNVTWANHQPAWGSVFATGSAAASIGWARSNVTNLVRDWHSGARANFGFTVIGNETPTERQRIYHTKEAGNGLAPRLIVTFTVINDDRAPEARVRTLPQWSPANFRVEWEGQDPPNSNGTPGSGIRHYDVWFSRDGGSRWTDWRAQVTTTSATFEGGQHLQVIDFTARAVDNAGNVQPRGGPQARTTVDAVAPEASVNPLPEFTHSTTFMVTWGGTDSGSGIQSYDIQWRLQTGTWQTLIENTTQTSFQFVGAQPGQTYLFRGRARDRVGNVQPFPDPAQARTTIAVKPESIIVRFDPQPVFQNLNGPQPGDGFQVYWKGFSSPGTSIASYDLDFRRPGSQTWLSWLVGVNFETARFGLAVGDPDGVYQFRVTATDNTGEREDVKTTPDGSIIVDRIAPFVLPQSYMPIIAFPDE